MRVRRLLRAFLIAAYWPYLVCSHNRPAICECSAETEQFEKANFEERKKSADDNKSNEKLPSLHRATKSKLLTNKKKGIEPYLRSISTKASVNALPFPFFITEAE